MATPETKQIDCEKCGAVATVRAHTSASVNSRTVPRCKKTGKGHEPCSKVCPHCWSHFIPEVIQAHINTDAGYGRGCASGPLPDPLATKD